MFIFSLLLEVPDRIGESSGKNDGEIFISINYNIGPTAWG